jgi:anti-sigma regulatory factor (Ser/Thr protein kinase)
MANENPASTERWTATEWDDSWESDIALETAPTMSLGEIIPLGEGAGPGDRFAVPADLAFGTLVRRQIQNIATEQSMSPDDTADLVLAVSEAFNNAVRHGTSRAYDPIEIAVAFGDGRATIEMRYRGEPFSVGVPQLPSAGSASGRGRYIMAMLLDDVVYQFDASWTTLLMAKNYRTFPAPTVLTPAE